MSEARLPAHLEVSGLIRAVEAAGGFATVLARGERDAGTLMVLCCDRGGPARAYERMPQPGGKRSWALARVQEPEDPLSFSEFWQRRRRQDGDLWVIELDVAGAEGFLGLPPPS